MPMRTKPSSMNMRTATATVIMSMNTLMRLGAGCTPTGVRIRRWRAPIGTGRTRITATCTIDRHPASWPDAKFGRKHYSLPDAA